MSEVPGKWLKKGAGLLRAQVRTGIFEVRARQVTAK